MGELEMEKVLNFLFFGFCIWFSIQEKKMKEKKLVFRLVKRKNYAFALFLFFVLKFN